jgi:type II secretory pathway pseudopilin PulG
MIEIQLVIGGICGIIAAVIAAHKGRRAVGWFFGGFFIGLVGIIIVAVLPNLKVQREQQAQAERERLRLREQLRQERLKSEAFRQYSTARLDVHDHALDLDTRSPAALPGPEEALRQLAADADPPASTVPPPNPAQPIWYYEINGQTMGPVSQLDVLALMEMQKIGRATLLWTEGFGEWTPAGQVPVFSAMVNP